MKDFINYVFAVASLFFGFFAYIALVLFLAIASVLLGSLIVTLFLMIGFKILGIYSIGTFVITFLNVFKLVALVFLIVRAIKSLFTVSNYN